MQQVGHRVERQVPARHVSADERQLELQLVQPVRGGDVGQPDVADRGPQRRFEDRTHPRQHRGWIAHVERAAGELARHRGLELRPRGRSQRSRPPSSRWCTNVPTRVPPGMSPRSDGTSRSAASSSDASAAGGGPSGASSSRSRASGSLVTTGSWVAPVIPL